MTRKLTFCQAINEALHLMMERDKNTLIMGEGVDDPRTIFGSTQGLAERFGPRRVFDIPLSENGMTGVMVGAALSGMRPIMTHQRIDFTLYAMDQIANHAAKRSYSSGGIQSVPITIRAIVGRGWGQGSQHSQSLQAIFAHIPGLKVVMPSSAYDAKGLLLASILDNNPVIFIEYRKLYDEVGEVPEDFYTVPLGQGVAKRTGKDVTVVAFSYMVQESLRAAAAVEPLGIEVEVIDPRTLKPLDETSILKSVRKTGRLVVVDTAWKTCGMAAEVSALAAEHAFDFLKAPIRRITLPDIPTPSSYALEKFYYPGPTQIVQAICDVVGKDMRNVKELFAAPEGEHSPSLGQPF
jgi:pyruvate/2-oxoglutarate/acetoin dehydrogenase E1 component